jgi:hypothetical protein
MDREAKDRLTDLVQHASGQTLPSLSCPACGGGLSVQYTPRGKGALSVMCASCRWRIVRDGLPAEPAWVRELGRTVQTMREPVATRPAS